MMMKQGSKQAGPSAEIPHLQKQQAKPPQGHTSSTRQNHLTQLKQHHLSESKCSNTLVYEGQLFKLL